MFAEALKLASNYTQPVIVSQKHFDGTANAGCASFIVVNEEGWILTSAHVIAPMLAAKHHESEIANFNKQESDIQNNNKTPRKKRRQLLRKLKPNPQWITNLSFWWANDNFRINNFKFNQLKDIATGKIESYDQSFCSNYPVFKDPKDSFSPGTSLCRLGFPLHDVNTTFNEETGQWKIDAGVLPMPRFPLDGIHTRVCQMVDQKANRMAEYIETSSPGLRGQSGGPIFDRHGHIWGLQSRTHHFNLGFSPPVKSGNKEIKEHQFINVGLGTHVKEIVKFLTEHQISFRLSTDS